MKKLNITVGADPELFVVNAAGAYRSAHGMIPGTKKDPFKVDKGAVQVDGMALEFNIDAVDNADDFVGNINTVMAAMKDMIPADLNFAIVPSCRFNGNHFRAQPDEAKELGCEPDYNAYTLKANPRPDNNTTMRTASGHIHIGGFPTDDPLSDEHMTRCATLVKQLDVYLGLASLFWDKDTSRRKMYGATGAFRPKPYGLEYRVLSNAWLLNEARMRFVFNQTVKAVNDLIGGKRAIEQVGDELTQRIIASSDAANAGYYLRYQVAGGQQMYTEAAKLAA